MDILYKLSINRPETHLVNLRLIANRQEEDHIDLFMPSWSPGSYFMREYARNVKFLHAFSASGNRLHCEKLKKGIWRVYFDESSSKGDKFEIHYDVFCHDLTVRTSHVDRSHAFIHGPSVFLGILGKDIRPQLEIEMNPLWSKISTGLRDISDKRDLFLYSADNYDDFIDCPLEIGCHETDGFMLEGVPHELATYGTYLGDPTRFKKDIKHITQHIVEMMGGCPYDRYIYISHFAPHTFGGLEHKNSTVLQYDSYSMCDEKGYRGWLELVAHEFFHTWNVKRIRPKELGPFEYTKETYTRMHWLTEGLTSFMDQQIIFRCGLASLENYLDCLKENINKYLKTPGRKYQSLEDSSFDAWIKLYHGGEFHNNSSVSYYLKGGIVFLVIHLILRQHNKSILDFVLRLWNDYKKRPQVGFDKDEVFAIFEDLASTEVKDKIKYLIESVDEIDIESYFNEIGLEVEYEDAKLDLGFSHKVSNGRIVLTSVLEDGAAYRYGLNAGDEIVALNGMRFDQKVMAKLDKVIEENKNYTFTVFREGYLTEVTTSPIKGIRTWKNIKVVDEAKAMAALTI